MPHSRTGDRRPARRRGRRRHVRRAALRLPHHHRADKSETARTVAANNIVNSGAMVVGSLIAFTAQSGWALRSPTAAARRGDVRDLGLARLEAPPRLRLSVQRDQDKYEQKAGGEGHCEQLAGRADSIERLATGRDNALASPELARRERERRRRVVASGTS